MARPNYSHSKRQREIVKKQKREEKLAKKLEKKTAGPDDVENMQPLDGPVPPEGAEETEPES